MQPFSQMSPSSTIPATPRSCRSNVQRAAGSAACACAIQNFMLSLAEEGIGSKWMTGALGAAPEDVRYTSIPAECSKVFSSSTLSAIALLEATNIEAVPEEDEDAVAQVAHPLP